MVYWRNSSIRRSTDLRRCGDEDLKRISTGQWRGSTWQKASPIWDPLTVPPGFSSHRPSARRQSRDSTREVSDVMTRIDHVSATTDEPTVSGAGSLPEPRPRPGRHPRPAPRRIRAKKKLATPVKNVSVPRDASADRPLRSLPFPASGGHPQLRGDGTRECGECPSPARPTFPPTAAKPPAHLDFIPCVSPRF